jgi:hypothetical protein
MMLVMIGLGQIEKNKMGALRLRQSEPVFHGLQPCIPRDLVVEEIIIGRAYPVYGSFRTHPEKTG